MKAFSQTQRGIVNCNLLDIETLPLLLVQTKKINSIKVLLNSVVDGHRRKTLSEANVIMDSFGELAKISPMCLLPVCGARRGSRVQMQWIHWPCLALEALSGYEHGLQVLTLSAGL